MTWRLDRLGPIRRSSSSSAAPRPSTTSRSCPGRRSPPALAERGLAVQPVLIDLDGRGGGCRPTTARGRPGDRATTTRPPLGASGPFTIGAAARPAWRPWTRSRWSSSPCTARSARTARSRPCSRRPTSPYTGSRRRGVGDRHGQGCSSSGWCAGSACRSSTWREVHRDTLGDRSGGGRSRSSRRSPPSTDEPRLMVKPAALGSSVGMTIAHDAAERDAGARGGLPLRRRSRSSSATCRAPGSSRSPSSATGRVARAVRPGRGLLRVASSTTTRRSTRRACPRRRPRPRSSRASARTAAQVRARRVPGDRRRAASRASTSSWRATRSTSRRSTRSPGFTPISLFPTMPAAGGYDFSAVCVRIVDLALERIGRGRRAGLVPSDLPRGASGGATGATAREEAAMADAAA